MYNCGYCTVVAIMQQQKRKDERNRTGNKNFKKKVASATTDDWQMVDNAQTVYSDCSRIYSIINCRNVPVLFMRLFGSDTNYYYHLPWSCRRRRRTPWSWTFCDPRMQKRKGRTLRSVTNRRQQLYRIGNTRAQSRDGKCDERRANNDDHSVNGPTNGRTSPYQRNFRYHMPFPFSTHNQTRNFFHVSLRTPSK